MSRHSGLIGALVIGLLAMTSSVGCGGANSAQTGAAGPPPAQSEQEYQQQLEKARLENLAKAKAARGDKRK